jgi:hypothetical protein
MPSLLLTTRRLDVKIMGRWVALVAAFVLVAACGDDTSGSSEATTAATTTTVAIPTTAVLTTTTAAATPVTTAADAGVRSLDAVAAAITVDGDASDWDGVPGLDLTLGPIEGEEQISDHVASVKVAYDDEFLYLLFTVEDDFNWSADDPHLSAAPSVMWAIDAAAGTGMGSDDPGAVEDDNYNSLGMVDIWHWELECAIGEDQGGAVTGPGEGNDPGNDSGCNFDDEWSTDPVAREDDNGEGAENSLLGVFSHSNPVADGAGTWIFEIRRPLRTGDPQDAQFAAGDTALMALAYWDADNSPEGWDDPEHVQSASQGWIEVDL